MQGEVADEKVVDKIIENCQKEELLENNENKKY